MKKENKKSVAEIDWKLKTFLSSTDSLEAASLTTTTSSDDDCRCQSPEYLQRCQQVEEVPNKTFLQDSSCVEDENTISIILRKNELVYELKESFDLVHAMSSKNPTPVVSNPRGLGTDRTAYQKYINSVLEAEKQKYRSQLANKSQIGKSSTPLNNVRTAANDNKTVQILGKHAKCEKTFSESRQVTSTSVQQNGIDKSKVVNFISAQDKKGGQVPAPDRPNTHFATLSSSKPSSTASSKSSAKVTSRSSSGKQGDAEDREQVLVVDTATRRRFERERQRAVRQQTVLLTKPLNRWILTASEYIEPRLRLESLRRSNAKSLNTGSKPNDNDDLKKGISQASVDEMMDVYAKHSFAKEVNSPKHIISPSTLDENNNTNGEKVKVKNLWDQRIDEHDKWLQTEINRPKNLHKTWKPSELLSASLLAVNDEENLQPLVALGAAPQKPADPLFTYPINYLELKKMQSTMNEQFTNGHGQRYDPYGDQDIHDVYAPTSLRFVSETRNQWQQRVDETGSNVPRPSANYLINRQSQLQKVDQQYGSNSNIRTVEQSVPHRKMQVEADPLKTYQQEPPKIHQQEQPKVYQQEQPKIVYQQQQIPVKEKEINVISPPYVYYEQKVAPSIEREQQLLLTYLQTHPHVVSSLGIAVPHQLRQRFQPASNTRVELLEVVQPNYYEESIPDVQRSHYPRSISSDRVETPPVPTMGKGSFSSTSYNGPSKSAQRMVEPRYVVSPLVQQQQQQTVQPQPVIQHQQVVQQLQRPVENVNKPWKVAEWVDPPPPVNRNENLLKSVEETENIVYKSPGESIIAREIRELKEREAELRSSRNELQRSEPPQLDESTRTWGDSYERQESTPLRGAQSYDPLQVVVENGIQQSEVRGDYDRVPTKTTGSMDHLQQLIQSNKRNSRPTNVVYQQQQEDSRVQQEQQSRIVDTSNSMYTRGGSKTLYEQFLLAHHPNSPTKLLQTFEYNNQQQPNPVELVQQNVVYPVRSNPGQNGNKSDFVPITSRIEQEVEELKRREAELKRQREQLKMSAEPVHDEMYGNVNEHDENDEYSSGRRRN